MSNPKQANTAKFNKTQKKKISVKNTKSSNSLNKTKSPICNKSKERGTSPVKTKPQVVPNAATKPCIPGPSPANTANLIKDTEERINSTQKYSKRAIVSNWTRNFDMPKDESDDDVANFQDLINDANSFLVGNHFMLKEEQEWLQKSETSDSPFLLDLNRLEAGISSIPFYTLLDLPESSFGPTELQTMKDEAKMNEISYKELETNLKGDRKIIFSDLNINDINDNRNAADARDVIKGNELDAVSSSKDTSVSSSQSDDVLLNKKENIKGISESKVTLQFSDGCSPASGLDESDNLLSTKSPLFDFTLFEVKPQIQKVVSRINTNIVGKSEENVNPDPISVEKCGPSFPAIKEARTFVKQDNRPILKRECNSLSKPDSDKLEPDVYSREIERRLSNIMNGSKERSNENDKECLKSDIYAQEIEQRLDNIVKANKQKISVNEASVQEKIPSTSKRVSLTFNERKKETNNSKKETNNSVIDIDSSNDIEYLLGLSDANYSSSVFKFESSSTSSNLSILQEKLKETKNMATKSKPPVTDVKNQSKPSMSVIDDDLDEWLASVLEK